MLLTLVWTLACLAGIDAAINVAFRYPADPKQQAGSLPTYFEYGRSIEGKLRRMVGPTDAKSDGLVTAGWPDRVSSAVASPPPGKLGVAVYGMSFSNQIARAMQELDPSVAPTMYAGPSAPPNHSYACFVAQNDGGRERNPVQVFAVLASSVKGLLTLGGSTTTFEKPAPFTFPRYTLGANGSLTEIRPIVATVEDLRAAVADDAKWTAHIEQLARHDRFYDPLLMTAGPGDRSAVVRMVRRAYAQNESRERAAAVGGAEGFRDDPEVGPVLRAMVRDFAKRCRNAGQVPLVLLIQDRPFRDALHTLLGPTLTADGVAYVSTHELAPTTDPSNFLGDGHFTHAVNLKLGQQMLEAVRAALAKSKAGETAARSAGTP